MKPKVTIGICAKNAENTLNDAVLSVARQDYNHDLMEIVFVDDGSTDNTLNMMKTFSSKIDFPVRIFSGPWRGIAKARNTVVREALGDFVVWLDSDEVLASDFVRKQVKLIEQNPEAGIATAKMEMRDSDTLVLKLDLIPYIAEYSTKNWRNPSKLPGTGATTYRLEAIKATGGFNEELYGACEDIELAYRITHGGWTVVRGDAAFFENHEKMDSLATLWKRSIKRGIHSRQLHNKTTLFFSFYTMNPLASFIASVRYAALGFLVTKEKISFLLPFYFTFKMTAWYYGFTKNVSS